MPEHAAADTLSITNLDELEALAQAKLPRMVFDYIAGGSGDEVTLRDNRAAFSRLRFAPRMLRGGAPSLDTTVLGDLVSFPVLIAPMAMHGLVCEHAEVATARAAAAAGTIMCASTLSNRAMEEIAAEAPSAPRWFQLYVYRDRGLTRELVERAAAAGYRALCLTVDTPLTGQRDRDTRNAFRTPDGLSFGNFRERGADIATARAAAHGSGLATYIASQWDQSISWRDVAWLRSISPLPVIVKGILAADDATLALDHGAAAIVVSNHGGRQLDGVLASIDALPPIVDAVADRAEIYLDGGIRRGTDVLKSLAFGARAVLLGRPILWGLTLAGESGARAVLDHLRAELSLAMSLAGCTRVDAIDRGLVMRSSV